jgi:hypothetical protein
MFGTESHTEMSKENRCFFDGTSYTAERQIDALTIEEKTEVLSNGRG